MQTTRLYICPTPIGNIADVSIRLLETLRNADTVCAEDTRVTSKVLAAHGIEKPLERLDEAVMGKRIDYIMERLKKGETIAYCSDAGMPGVSDPGLALVRAAQKEGIPYEVLPGPSAVLTAYTASGFLCQNFYFAGFLPRKKEECRHLLDQLSSLNAVLIFFESPKRIVTSLATISEVFPFREVAVCRELTKLHEEIVRLPAAEMQTFFKKREESGPIKGEIVVLIDAPTAAEREQRASELLEEATKRAQTLKEQGAYTNKDIIAMLRTELGIARNDAYDIVVSL